MCRVQGISTTNPTQPVHNMVDRTLAIEKEAIKLVNDTEFGLAS